MSGEPRTGFDDLWRAIRHGDLSALDALLAGGADPCIINPSHGWAGVHHLMHSAMGRANESEGPNFRLPKPTKESREEITRSTIELLRLMVSHQPKCLEARDAKGNTPIILAAGFLGGRGGEWCRAVLEALLVAGADPHALNKKGQGISFPLQGNEASLVLLEAYGWRPAGAARAAKAAYCVGTKEFDCGHRHLTAKSVNKCFGSLRGADERAGVSCEYVLYRIEPDGSRERARLEGVEL